MFRCVTLKSFCSNLGNLYWPGTLANMSKNYEQQCLNMIFMCIGWKQAFNMLEYFWICQTGAHDWNSLDFWPWNPWSEITVIMQMCIFQTYKFIFYCPGGILASLVNTFYDSFMKYIIVNQKIKHFMCHFLICSVNFVSQLNLSLLYWLTVV